MADLTLTEKDNGKTMEISVGTSLHISLEENVSTGYEWSLRDFQEGVLTNESDSPPSVAVPKAPPPADPPGAPKSAPSHSLGHDGSFVGQVVGAPTTRNFTFAARSPGTLTLTLKYMRPWEPEDKAGQQFAITVNVK